MFSDFYVIPEQPFGESPDPRFLYPSSAHSKTLAALLGTAEKGHRLQTLIAPPGLGKTTLMYAMLDRLRDRVDSAFVFYTVWSARDLLGFMLREFGVAHQYADLASRRKALESFLAVRENGARPVLAVVDEAHNLDCGALEEIDSLLSRAPLSFRVILTGQPRLSSNLDSIAPSSLRSRVAATHDLSPLDTQQIAEYIRHRLEMAGYVGGELFTDGAVEKITAESSGIPRQINMLCSHALDHGATMKKHSIDEQEIAEVISHWQWVLSNPDEQTSSVPELLTQANHVLDSVVGPTPERTVVRQSQGWEHQHSLRLARALRSWLVTHSEVWSGTAGELYKRLHPEFADELAGLTISSPAELLQRIDLHVAALLELGVDVEVRHRTGQPRRLVLRLMNTPPLRSIA